MQIPARFLNQSLLRMQLAAVTEQLDALLAAWSIRRHLVLAGSVVLLAGGAGWCLADLARQRLVSAQMELASLQSSGAPASRAADARSEQAGGQLFGASSRLVLPQASSAGTVLSFLTEIARKEAVTILALTRQQTSATATSLGRTSFTVTAHGEYGQLKGWLAQALGRYPALGVDTLTLKNALADGSRQELQVNLTLYTRD